MLQLFVPQLKVQKDRKTMRETDFRMAKYSRRGIILNFCAYLLCLVAGSFADRAHQLAIVLTIGLVLITLLRGYFLYRFGALYSRAPARWRNQYFIASFIGAAWWSLIVVSVTTVVGMQDETPLVWLYTVVFYSTTANAFAPYRQFLKFYHFIGLVPAAFAALVLGTLEGYLYGVMMIVFYLMLNHQGRGVAETYWDRLDANYALKQKARDLEVEKRDTQAAVELNNEFMANLSHEFRTSLNDVIGALTLLEDSPLESRQRELLGLAEKASKRQLDLVNNVMDFSRITSKELVMDVGVFNLRRHFETLIDELAVEANQQGVELNYIIDPTMPLRVRGDAARLEQILMHLISNVVKFSERGEVVVKASFDRQTDEEGELYIAISDEGGTSLAAQEELFNAFARGEATQAGTGLGLAICRGLAECMGGGAGLSNEAGQSNQLWVKVKLGIADKQVQRFNANPKLHGRRCLLVNTQRKIVDSYLRELESWGIATEAVYGFQRALQRLDRAQSSEHPFDLLVLHNPLQNFSGLDFSRELCADPVYRSIKQVIAVSRAQSSSEEVLRHLERYPQAAVITKPVLRQPLHDTFNRLLFNTDAQTSSGNGKYHDHDQGVGHQVLLVEDHRVNQMVAEGMLKKLGYKVVLANNGREALNIVGEQDFDLILMDCQMPEMDGYMAAREIRNLETGGELQRHVPIIAMTAHAAEGDQARCLAAGMDDYLPKPVRYDELESRLKRWLGSGGELRVENGELRMKS